MVSDMTRTYRALEREQLQKQMDSALSFGKLRQPKSGWVSAARNALGMTAATLGKRMGTTQPNITALEKSEREGRATIKSLSEAAEAMGCRFVYAFVPAQGESVTSIIEAQAQRKARKLVQSASVQMALEAQQLDPEAVEREIQRLKSELLATMPRDFWAN